MDKITKELSDLVTIDCDLKSDIEEDKFKT